MIPLHAALFKQKKLPTVAKLSRISRERGTNFWTGEQEIKEDTSVFQKVVQNSSIWALHMHLILRLLHFQLLSDTMKISVLTKEACFYNVSTHFYDINSGLQSLTIKSKKEKQTGYIRLTGYP